VLEIIRASALADLEAVRRLIQSHAATIRHHAGAEALLADAATLPGPYGPPRGALYLATLDGIPVGCVALHDLDAQTGEVKRMFVSPVARRRGVARALMQQLMDDARACGYTRLRLGTLDEMTAAQALYQELGFVRIPTYRPGDPVDTVFFECKLGEVEGSNSP